MNSKTMRRTEQDGDDSVAGRSATRMHTHRHAEGIGQGGEGRAGRGQGGDRAATAIFPHERLRPNTTTHHGSQQQCLFSVCSHLPPSTPICISLI